MNYLKPAAFLHKLFPEIRWQFPDNKQNVYFSFDDGPHPDISPRVWDLLEKYNAKASFFMTGKQAESYPHLVREALERGHTVGSHSYSHWDAWKCNPSKWNQDVIAGHSAICQAAGQEVNYFRPPYGHFIPYLNKFPEQTQCVLWSVMPGDFDDKIQPDDLMNRIKTYGKNGSIIVLHDNIKCKEKLLKSLPEILDYFQRKNVNLVGITK